MQQDPTIMAKLAEVRDAKSGVIESRRALSEGVPQSFLSELCTEGKLVRVGRGQFVVPMDRQDEMTVLAYEKDFVFSHQSALYLHGLLDSPGERHAVTCVEGAVLDPQVSATCDVHYVPRELYDMGRTLGVTKLGNLVPSYDLERSVCDVAAARDELGPDTFLTVVTRYAKDSRFDENKLYEYGDRLQISDDLRNYLEVLMWAQSAGDDY